MSIQLFGLHTDLFLLCVMTGKKEGKSRVKSQGPFSAVASASPSVFACWAASSSADLGKPSTCATPRSCVCCWHERLILQRYYKRAVLDCQLNPMEILGRPSACKTYIDAFQENSVQGSLEYTRVCTGLDLLGCQIQGLTWASPPPACPNAFSLLTRHSLIGQLRHIDSEIACMTC